mgnify:FL=1
MGASDSDCAVVLCTAPQDAAASLARGLVEARLCACVNVLPGVRSYYRWEGAVEEADEVLLVIKTKMSALAALEDRLVALHPYDVPEFLALDVQAGLPAYLNWVIDSVEEPGGS